VWTPSWLQIIANTEVWDLRTFHLLQTVPVLDQRNCTFSPMHVIYGASLGADRDHDMDPTTYDTSFNVLDAYDYSSIATIDINTGSKVASFTPTIPNLYTKNRATLCRTDELILSGRERFII